MDAPTWTEVLSADAALWAAIFAGLSFLATAGAVIVAVVALRWARRAAMEAGKQAKAAIDAVEWSRKAAEAAQGQIAIIERQIELSEPQPVVMLHLSYSAWQISNGWKMSIENVGEELAFDVHVDEMNTAIGPSRPIGLVFPRIAVLKIGHDLPLTPNVEPLISSLGENPDLSQPQRFLQVLLTAHELRAKKLGVTSKDICVQELTVRYRNARGQYYEMQFDLWMRNFVRLETKPHGSLLRRKVEDEPGITTPIHFSVLEDNQVVLNCATLYEAAKAWDERPQARVVHMIGRAPFDEFEVRTLRVPQSDLEKELQSSEGRQKHS